MAFIRKEVFMKTTTALALLATAAAISGCAYRPIVDPARTDMAKYEKDLVECRQIAEQAPGAGTGALVGAGAGYALGQVTARATGRSAVANEAGRGGAVLGAAGGAGSGARNKRQVIKNCMIGRGHPVLD
jgi:outer membrane lipoprotein SlyB